MCTDAFIFRFNFKVEQNILLLSWAKVQSCKFKTNKNIKTVFYALGILWSGKWYLNLCHSIRNGMLYNQGFMFGAIALAVWTLKNNMVTKNITSEY